MGVILIKHKEHTSDLTKKRTELVTPLSYQNDELLISLRSRILNQYKTEVNAEQGVEVGILIIASFKRRYFVPLAPETGE